MFGSSVQQKYYSAELSLNSIEIFSPFLKVTFKCVCLYLLSDSILKTSNFVDNKSTYQKQINMRKRKVKEIEKPPIAWH